MIDDLPSLRVFARVVATGSLSAAARDLGLSLPVVSKRLARLESALGLRLLQRTTRRQTLTEEGALFHARVERILTEVDDAESLMSRRSQAISGQLRVTAPAALGRRHIAPLLGEFQVLHPQITVQLELTDQVLNLFDSGVDMAVRFGGLEDSSLVARVLAPNYRVLCAAPGYIARHGMPTHPDELPDHACILIGQQPSAVWQFDTGETAPASVRITGSLVTNDGDAAHEWALAGLGIALKSVWDVGDDLRLGRLTRVLVDYPIPAAPLNALFPHSRHRAPRVRAFSDFLTHALRRTWRWDTP